MKNKFKVDSFFIIAFMVMLLFILVVGAYALHFAPNLPQWMQGFFSSTSNDPSDWGTFGDYVGGMLNPLFGFFGFMTLIITVRLQRQQLDDQRQAMQQQEKEMEAQRESLAISNKTQIKQQFEGSFFVLLDQLDQEFVTNTPTYAKSSTVQATSSPGEELVDIYKYCLHNFVIGKYAACLYKVFLEICNIRRKIIKYFKILRIALISIDSIAYSSLQEQSALDKNFYVDLLLARQGKEKILALALPYIDPYIDLSIYFNSEEQRSALQQNSIDFTNCLLVIDLSLKPIISRLGLLRELDFSPFNDQIFEPSLGTYARHPITLALLETFGEQAFRPIEVPPVNN